MTFQSRSASPAATLGSASLYALCVLAFGASVVLVASWLLGTGGSPDAALGVAVGGGGGLLIATQVFRAWVRALARSTQDLWRAFAVGFLVKAAILLAGTLALHFLRPGPAATAFAIAFALAVAWVSGLGIPYIHRRGGRPSGE